MPKSSMADATSALLDDYRWLVSPLAEQWLRTAMGVGSPLVAQVAQLRSQLTRAQTHLVLEQGALRKRAREKFRDAGEMFFTPRGLEQSTDEVVAAYKARRFPPTSRVFDLCCGLGGDLLALARRGEARGFDRDAVLAILAAANLRLLGAGETRGEPIASRSQVHERDVETLDVAECSAWHIDPDRRPSGRRTTRVELHEPGPLAMERLLAQNPNAAVKLAPAATLPDAWRERAELEWISRGGECRQLVVWFGDMARNVGRRCATVLGRGRQVPRSITGQILPGPPITNALGRYVLEPDAAVLAAKLEGTLAGEYDLEAIAAGVAYWTGERPIHDPALACFEVLEVLPFRIKPLKSLLRARNIGQLEIKKRGVKLDPAAVRRELKLAGEEAATLLVAPIERRTTAILARRVDVG